MCARMVVVDDEPQVLNLIARILRQAGHTVLEAGGGVSGLHLICQERPDLIVLDLMMPDLNGVKVMGALAAHPATATIPIIVLSGQRRGDGGDDELSPAVVAYLTKPFLPSDLTETVDAALVGRRRRRGDSATSGSPLATE